MSVPSPILWRMDIDYAESGRDAHKTADKLEAELMEMRAARGIPLDTPLRCHPHVRLSTQDPGYQR